MAGFKTHIMTSTVLGIGYGAAGYFALDIPLPTCVLSAGLCGVSGMLPDLDSDSGVPVREMIAFSAAVIPILMFDRFQQLGLSHEMMALAGGLIYLIIRFGVGRIFKRYTVHRGMWHSLPAALSVGLLAFLICSGEDMTIRMFKAVAVFAGFVSHLLLDEFWSVEMRRGRVRLKKSSGTALKFWSRRPLANLSTYGKLAALLALAISDPIVMQHLDQRHPGVPNVVRQWTERESALR
ncbi:MAG: metal-dependent hydrolase [Pirellulaceae bacterium]